jgi:hypothetical protein
MFRSPRWRATLALAAGALFALKIASAASLGSESSIAIASYYASNPYLLNSSVHAADSAAVELHLPVTYNGGEQTLNLVTNDRFAQKIGSVAALSDYQHVDADWRLAGEHNTFTLGAGWHRDSTLLNPFETEALAGHDVHRADETGAVGWSRHFGERNTLQLSGLWDHVAYDQSVGGTLLSYNYGQGSLELDHTFTSRLTGTSAVGYGHYELLDHSYWNDSRYVQLGVSDALAERWSLSAMGNYSYIRSRSFVPVFSCPTDPIVCLIFPELLTVFEVPVHTGLSSGSGSLQLERRYERGAIDLTASRALQPSGFGGLVNQDDFAVKGSYDWSELWTVSAKVHRARVSDPLHQVQLNLGRYDALELTSTWHIGEHWTLDFSSYLYRQQIAGSWPSSVGASLALTRRFDRVQLH